MSDLVTDTSFITNAVKWYTLIDHPVSFCLLKICTVPFGGKFPTVFPYKWKRSRILHRFPTGLIPVNLDPRLSLLRAKRSEKDNGDENGPKEAGKGARAWDRAWSAVHTDERDERGVAPTLPRPFCLVSDHVGAIVKRANGRYPTSLMLKKDSTPNAVKAGVNMNRSEI